MIKVQEVLISVGGGTSNLNSKKRIGTQGTGERKGREGETRDRRRNKIEHF